MKRMFTIAFAFAIALGGAAAGFAAPGPNGNNNHGLCTAFFNGQKNGHEKQKEKNDSYPRPFQGLVDTAGDQDGDGDVDEADVYLYCQAFGIGGNPDNGRWDCTLDDNGTPDDTSDDTAECERDTQPGPDRD